MLSGFWKADSQQAMTSLTAVQQLLHIGSNLDHLNQQKIQINALFSSTGGADRHPRETGTHNSSTKP